MNEIENHATVISSVRAALEGVEVKGRQNHAIILACMNDLDRVIKSMKQEKENREKEETDGDIHNEPEA